MTTADTTPEFARIPETCRRFGLSRSRLYLLAGEGAVRFIKGAAIATLVGDLGFSARLLWRPAHLHRFALPRLRPETF